MKSKTLSFVFAALAALAVASTAFADHGGKHLANVNRDGVLVDGYDVVAYFADGLPIMGSKEFTSTVDGATYWFASAEYKTLFDANPAKYAPQFGGFCAVGASFGKKIDIDPAQWRLLDGKLYLNSGAQAQALWLQDEPGTAAKAAASWPAIKDKTPKELSAN